jgi:hypothetical protein
VNIKANQANRASRASGENFYLRVADRYVDLMLSVPEFRDLSTAQLIHLLPSKCRRFVPPAAREDRMARAVCIGMLAHESQIDAVISTQFLERSFIPS